MFDELFARITVVATTVTAVSNVVLASVRGLADNDEDEGEVSENVTLLGALGLLARPRAKDANGRVVGLAVRAGDELLPFALMDRRISRARGTLPEGAISLAGYLGQHVTLEDGTAGGAKITLALSGATITIDSSPPGPTITVSRDGPPASSITLGPDGNVAITGVALTFNGTPMQVP